MLGFKSVKAILCGSFVAVSFASMDSALADTVSKAGSLTKKQTVVKDQVKQTKRLPVKAKKEEKTNVPAGQIVPSQTKVIMLSP